MGKIEGNYNLDFLPQARKIGWADPGHILEMFDPLLGIPQSCNMHSVLGCLLSLLFSGAWGKKSWVSLRLCNCVHAWSCLVKLLNPAILWASVQSYDMFHVGIPALVMPHTFPGNPGSWFLHLLLDGSKAFNSVICSVYVDLLGISSLPRSQHFVFALKAALSSTAMIEQFSPAEKSLFAFGYH